MGLGFGVPPVGFDGDRLLAHAPLGHGDRRPVRRHGDARRGRGDLCPRHGGRSVVGTLVLCRPHAGDRPAGLLLGSADALRRHGRDDGHGACGTAPLHLPGVGCRGRGLRLGKRRLLGRGDRYGLPLLGRQHAHQRMALLDGLGQRPAGLFRGGVLETFCKVRNRRGQIRPCVVLDDRRRAAAREGGPVARERRGRRGEPRRGASRMGFRGDRGGGRQGVERRAVEGEDRDGGRDGEADFLHCAVPHDGGSLRVLRRERRLPWVGL